MYVAYIKDTGRNHEHWP